MEEENVKFMTFSELQDFIHKKEKSEFIQLYVNDSRTIASAKKRIKRVLKDDLKYYRIQYKCIHSGIHKSRSTGQRPKQRSFRHECPFVMSFKASDDGQTLDLISKIDEHNHAHNEETYSLLPRQRRLDGNTKEAVKNMLKLRVNKKLLQAEISLKTRVLLKDLHNLGSKNDCEDTLQDAIKYLRSKEGNIVEILKNSENDFLGLFYQDFEMQRTYGLFPEVLFVDSIYKVSNLRIPLYILLVENSNGESEIVGFMLVASEDAATINAMVEVLKKKNPAWEKTVTIMTDKDFLERQCFKNGFVNAQLLICLFHTLRTFKREINCEKMHISTGERVLCQEFAQRLTYAKNEADYNSILEEVRSLKLKGFLEYFEKNWHPIKEEWVPSLQTAFSLGNRTNNRLESINSKVLQVVQRHSRLPDLFQNLDVLLFSLRTERDAKAVNTLLKTPLNVHFVHEDQGKYLHELTPYRFGLVSEKFQLKDKVEIIGSTSDDQVAMESSQGLLTVTINNCSCRFFSSFNLPCHHILHFRQVKKLPLYDASLIPSRWRKEFYLDHSRLMLVNGQSQAAVVHQTSIPKKKVFSQNDKFRIASKKGLQVASLASEVSTKMFPQRLKVLEDLIALWGSGKEVCVVEANHDEDANFDPSSSNFDCNTSKDISFLNADYDSHEELTIQQVAQQNHIEIENCTTSLDDVHYDHSYALSAAVDDCAEMTDSISTSEDISQLSLLSMPPKLKRKGRPKGSNITVVGLPKKRGRISTVKPFERKC